MGFSGNPQIRCATVVTAATSSRQEVGNEFGIGFVTQVESQQAMGSRAGPPRTGDQGAAQRRRLETATPATASPATGGGRSMTVTRIFDREVGDNTAVVEHDLDAQGPAADLVRVYLNGIGKTALLTAEEEVVLAKSIEAGVFAQHVLDTAKRLTPTRRDEMGELVRDGRRAKDHLLEGQPAPRRVTREALHRPWHAAAGPDPGGQPGPDPRGGEVRLHQGLQVLDLRDVVDPSGHHPRHGRPGPHHPPPRPPRRAGEQARADQARPAPDARPRGHARGAREGVGPQGRQDRRPARPRA